MHVLDAASPMRFEWIETLADDARWQPLLHMHRPQEALVGWALAAHVAAVRDRPTGPTSGRPVDLVLSTGDNIDNAQRNELDAYLAVLAGGTFSLDPTGGTLDAGGLPTGAAWPYWSPAPGVVDLWKPHGYPIVDGLLDRLAAPVAMPGLGLPWSSLPGNHDLMCQGTALIGAALAASAVGDRKALFAPPGFVPDDPLTLFVESPAAFLGAGDRRITADPRRHPIDRAEWLVAHRVAGAVGFEPTVDGDGNGDGPIDGLVRLDGATIVLLDTNHPSGDYQGSIGRTQLARLDEHLTEADDRGDIVVVASHHGTVALVNHRGEDTDRVLAEPLLDVLHAHPCVVAWIVGHRHVNRVDARPGRSGGFWEITTSSIIDWPGERRSIEILRHADGTIEIVATLHRHDAPGGSIASLHHDLAHRFDRAERRRVREGRGPDRDVRLYLRR